MFKISQKNAKDKGLTFYFTGKPCKHGHIAERYVSGGQCRECKILKQKQFRQTYKEQISAYHKERHKKTYTTEKRRETYIKHAQREIWQRAKYRSIKHNIDFDIELEDIIITKYCPVFNIEMDFSDWKSSPSLDRIDNNKGYVKGNVCVISNKANKLKNNGSVEEFQQILKYMKKCIM